MQLNAIIFEAKNLKYFWFLNILGTLIIYFSTRIFDWNYKKKQVKNITF